jgi:glycosyltransferase involved in cell wall biosynthesis
MQIASAGPGLAAPRPDLSIIIPAVNGLDILLECLDALRRNVADDITLELVVVDRCGEPVRLTLAARAPDVVVLPVPPETTIPQMRAVGFQHARGEAIAVIEDHILVPHDWARQILRALATGAFVVGGSVYNAATATTVDWAAFICEYSHLLSPKAGRDVDRLTGNNVAYRREVVERYSALLGAGQWEDYFHDALRRDGIALMCAPEIAVGHKMHYRMTDYVSQRYLYSRALTGSTSTRLTLLQRAVGLVRSALLPPVLFARIVGRVWTSNRYRRELLQSLPLLAVFVCAWAAGEAVGYAAGPGNALARVR